MLDSGGGESGDDLLIQTTLSFNVKKKKKPNPSEQLSHLYATLLGVCVRIAARLTALHSSARQRSQRNSWRTKKESLDCWASRWWKVVVAGLPLDLSVCLSVCVCLSLCLFGCLFVARSSCISVALLSDSLSDTLQIPSLNSIHHSFFCGFVSCSMLFPVPPANGAQLLRELES